jgi:hypothetical protein
VNDILSRRFREEAIKKEAENFERSGPWAESQKLRDVIRLLECFDPLQYEDIAAESIHLFGEGNRR